MSNVLSVNGIVLFTYKGEKEMATFMTVTLHDQQQKPPREYNILANMDQVKFIRACNDTQYSTFIYADASEAIVHHHWSYFQRLAPQTTEEYIAIAAHTKLQQPVSPEVAQIEPAITFKRGGTRSDALQ